MLVYQRVPSSVIKRGYVAGKYWKMPQTSHGGLVFREIFQPYLIPRCLPVMAIFSHSGMCFFTVDGSRLGPIFSIPHGVSNRRLQVFIWVISNWNTNGFGIPLLQQTSVWLAVLKASGYNQSARRQTCSFRECLYIVEHLVDYITLIGYTMLYYVVLCYIIQCYVML